MFHNCLENCCRHVQPFPGIGRQPFDCRGYLEQPTAIFGAGGEKMWKFLEQAARKGGNLLRKILNSNWFSTLGYSCTESSPSIPLIFSHLSSWKYLRFNNSSLQPLVFVIHTSIDFCEEKKVCFVQVFAPPTKKSEINRWHFKYLMFTDNFLCSLSSLSSTHSYPPK